MLPLLSCGFLLSSTASASRNSRCDSGDPPVGYQSSSLATVVDLVPSTRIFFSGNRFPLATESSIEDHSSFFSELFGLSWSLVEETCVNVDMRFDIVAKKL